MSTQSDETVSTQSEKATTVSEMHFLGEIVHVAFTHAPRDYLPCDGRLLPINQNQSLFSLLGFRFGGDEKLNFALPNYNPSAPHESRYVICVAGRYPDK